MAVQGKINKALNMRALSYDRVWLPCQFAARLLTAGKFCPGRVGLWGVLPLASAKTQTEFSPFQGQPFTKY